MERYLSQGRTRFDTLFLLKFLSLSKPLRVIGTIRTKKTINYRSVISGKGTTAIITAMQTRLTAVIRRRPAYTAEVETRIYPPACRDAPVGITAERKKSIQQYSAREEPITPSLPRTKPGRACPIPIHQIGDRGEKLKIARELVQARLITSSDFISPLH